jgi:DNA repair protein RadD
MIQQIGRGTRIAENKVDCLVLDYGGNFARCGTIDDPIIPQPKLSLVETRHGKSGHCAERNAKISLVASGSPTKRGGNRVIKANYCVHESLYTSGAPSLRADYELENGSTVSEYFPCWSLGRNARANGKKKWRKRTNIPLPRSAADAVEVARQHFPIPYSVKIEKNHKGFDVVTPVFKHPKKIGVS